MKYTIAWCIYGYPNNTEIEVNAKCKDRCSGPNRLMSLAMTNQLLVYNISRQYTFCEDNGEAFTNNVDDCIACVQNVSGSQTLVNYLSALNDVCKQQPPADGKTTVKLSRGLSQDVVNGTVNAPPLSSSSPEASMSSSPLPTSTSSNSDHSSRKLGFGLGLGLGIPLVLVIAGATWFVLQQRARHSGQQLRDGEPLGKQHADYSIDADMVPAPYRSELDTPPAELGQSLRHEKE